MKSKLFVALLVALPIAMLVGFGALVAMDCGKAVDVPLKEDKVLEWEGRRIEFGTKPSFIQMVEAKKSMLHYPYIFVWVELPEDSVVVVTGSTDWDFVSYQDGRTQTVEKFLPHKNGGSFFGKVEGKHRFVIHLVKKD